MARAVARGDARLVLGVIVPSPPSVKAAFGKEVHHMDERESVEAQFEAPYFEQSEHGSPKYELRGFIWGAVGGAIAFLIMRAVAG